MSSSITQPQAPAAAAGDGDSSTVSNNTSHDHAVKVFLETTRLILRQFTEGDDVLLLDLDSDPEVMKYLTDGVPTSAEVIRSSHLPKRLRYHQAYEHLGYWVAIEKSSGQFIGWFCFKPARDPSEGIELGYRLKRQAWGKGYATEGSRAILKKGFSGNTGIKRVVAQTMKANTRSRNVMEKLGMRYVTEFVDPEFPLSQELDVLYAITREDFQRLQQQQKQEGKKVIGAALL